MKTTTNTSENITTHVDENYDFVIEKGVVIPPRYTSSSKFRDKVYKTLDALAVGDSFVVTLPENMNDVYFRNLLASRGRSTKKKFSGRLCDSRRKRGYRNSTGDQATSGITIRVWRTE